MVPVIRRTTNTTNESHHVKAALTSKQQQTSNNPCNLLRDRRTIGCAFLFSAFHFIFIIISKQNANSSGNNAIWMGGLSASQTATRNRSSRSGINQSKLTRAISSVNEPISSNEQSPSQSQQRYKMRSKPKDVYPYYHPIPSTGPDDFAGLRARPFKPWTYDKQLPCAPSTPGWNTRFVQFAPVRGKGLVFLSPFKTGSTTAVGIHLRLSQQLARRMYPNNYTSTMKIFRKTNVTEPIQMCETRYRHNWAFQVIRQGSRRPRKDTFVWTVVRDPTTRVISQFFYDLAENSRDTEPTDANFMKYLEESYQLQSLIYHHYIGRLAFKPLDWFNSSKYLDYADSLFRDLDFIAVTERMDESIVAMSMLLNVTLGDVLYLKSNKAAGDFSVHARLYQCNYILPSFVSPGVREFFKSDEWQDKMYWDHLVHQAANRSLDLTIDQLGRDEFNKRLALYQYAKKEAQKECLAVTPMPCSSTGVYTGNTDCLFLDAGCGQECLDRVVARLKI